MLWSETGDQLTTTDIVGIGTTTSSSQLHVNVAGSPNPITAVTIDVQSFETMANAQASHFLLVHDIGASPPNGATHFAIRGDGSVGIGTATPAFKLDVNGDIGVNGIDAIRRDASNAYIFPFGTGTANNVVVIGGGPGGNTGLQVGGALNVLGDISVGNVDAIRIDGNNAYIFPFGTNQVNNQVVIGGGPGGNTHLQVSGNVKVAGDVFLNGADCAEEFDSASGEPPEPGTVVVINEDGALRESQSAYDKRVAGVVSGAGEYKHGLVLDKRLSQEGRVPVALMGKVYCKVDAQYSPIEVGDLLTTSHTHGHAMKAEDPLKAFGAVIGKALKPLKRGQEMIPILIALQ